MADHHPHQLPADLDRAARDAPLVRLMLEFLAWIGPGRNVSRDRVSHPSPAPRYTVVSLGRHLAADDDPEPGAGCPCERWAELLAMALEIRVLTVAVERTEQLGAGGARQHGRVLPGPEYTHPGRDVARLLRLLAGAAPVVWCLLEPRLFHVPAERAMRGLVRLLAPGRPVPLTELRAAVERAGAPPIQFASGLGVLCSLGLAEGPVEADDGPGPDGEPAVPHAVATPLGRYVLDRAEAAH